MRILHLSADYPDPVDPTKTSAIRNLLRLAPEQSHRVFSLNRTSFRQPFGCQTFVDDVSNANRAVQYPALPKGIRHAHFLEQLADCIAGDCQHNGYKPDVIHAHKLTAEGIAGLKLANHFGVPLVVSAQGNTDLKIVRAKPGLRNVFRKIWHEASVALPFAPWTRDDLNAILGQRTGSTPDLPCPGAADRLIDPVLSPPVVRTAFNLRDHRNKNAEGLFRAIGLAARQLPQIVLEVIGGGDDEARDALRKSADRHAKGHVRFRGAVAHGEMQALLNTSAAFALVSHRESFGMVFSEALLAGTPCLIPAGRAIDGYLRDGEVTLSADPSNPGAIAKQLLRLIRDQRQFKSTLGRYHRAGKLDFLRREAIADTYENALQHARRMQVQPRFAYDANPVASTQRVSVSA